MKKLPFKDKIFWKNYAYFLLIFISACLVFGNISNDIDGQSGGYSFLDGYLVASFLAVLWLGYKVAIYFVINEEIEDFIEKNKISRKEFYNKYGELIDIIDR